MQTLKIVFFVVLLPLIGICFSVTASATNVTCVQVRNISNQVATLHLRGGITNIGSQSFQQGFVAGNRCSAVFRGSNASVLYLYISQDNAGTSSMATLSGLNLKTSINASANISALSGTVINTGTNNEFCTLGSNYAGCSTRVIITLS